MAAEPLTTAAGTDIAVDASRPRIHVRAAQKSFAGRVVERFGRRVRIGVGEVEVSDAAHRDDVHVDVRDLEPGYAADRALKPNLIFRLRSRALVA